VVRAVGFALICRLGGKEPVDSAAAGRERLVLGASLDRKLRALKLGKLGAHGVDPDLPAAVSVDEFHHDEFHHVVAVDEPLGGLALFGAGLEPVQHLAEAWVGKRAGSFRLAGKP